MISNHSFQVELAVYYGEEGERNEGREGGRGGKIFDLCLINVCIGKCSLLYHANCKDHLWLLCISYTSNKILWPHFKGFNINCYKTASKET